jgi:uncharacterized protein DUF4386
MNQPTKKDARLAGALYLLLLAAGPFSLVYVPAKLIVDRDAAATSHNILTHETMFRAGIVAELLGTVIFMFVVFALYRLLSGVNAAQASAMVILGVLSVPITFAGAVNNIAALTLFRGGDFFAAVPKAMLDTLAMLFLRLHFQTIVVNEIFWGLWLLPLGLLIMRSRFLPWILGLWLTLACFAWLADSVTMLLVPDYIKAVHRVTFYGQLGEPALILWLVIMGVRVKPPVVATA